MPLWGWLFIATCIAYGALVLWRAWTKNFVKFGPIHYTRSDYPISFWFFVVLFCIGEVWWIGLSAAVIISLVRGPIFSQH